MPSTISVNPYVCTRCLFRQSTKSRRYHGLGGIRKFSTTSPHKDELSSAPQTRSANEKEDSTKQEKAEGAMSRRLADMTEETIESGGQTARKAVEEAGFSEELKRQLEAKIQDGHFRNKNPAAFAQVNMPVRHFPLPLLCIADAH